MTKRNIEQVKTKKYGKLTILEEAPRRYTKGGKNSVRRVTAVCDCGTTKEYDLNSIVKGKTKSCGCIIKSGEAQTKHVHKKDGKYICTTCKEYKDANLFFKYHSGKADATRSVQRRDGLRNECKQCFNKRKQKEYLNRTPRMNLGTLVSGARTRSKTANLEFDIDTSYVKQMYDDQLGCCALSGMPFELNLTQGKNTKSPSIDRVDPSKGYIRGNIQLVCSHVNMMKSYLSIEELYEFCAAILSKRKQDG